MKTTYCYGFIILFSLFGNNLKAQELIFEFKKGQSASLHGQYGREAVFQDALLYHLMKNDALDNPKPTMLPLSPRDTIRWSQTDADLQGWFQHRNLRGGYLLTEYNSPARKIAVLEANGHQEVFVNGIPRGGDVYGYGWIEHPVELKKGTNHFLFHVARGRVKATIVSPDFPVYLSDRDVLVPDYVKDDNKQSRLGAVRIINATSKQIKGWKIRFEFNSTHVEDYPIPLITSLSSRKVAFKIPQIPAELLVGPETSGRLLIVDEKGRIQGNPEGLNLSFAIKTAGEKHKVTFISSIDGSVQYYAVVPPVDGFKEGQALFVTLHGASVEAQGQANAYSAKDWGTIVAPTNRRPYGFDWEDWGRADAMEVLDIALDTYKPDLQRLYLTGHSMGGHGTWHIGLTFPGIWAAIAPSAGWVSFWSYAGKQHQSQPDPLREVFNRASAPSNTLSLMNNTRQFGVYVLHGDKDDNVPVDQARIMRDTLGRFHPDFCYYEEPGAGHWWGNQCVDWPPLFDFFKHHKRKTALETSAFSFTTAFPGVSSQSGWVSVWQQSEPGIPSSVDVVQDTIKGQIRLQTRNVQMIRLNLDHIPSYQSWNLTVDGIEMTAKAGERGDLYLVKAEGGWKTGHPDFNQKNPFRNGGFKDVFNHKVVLVYGTKGNDREDELNFMKARFDAETFWYRANGSLELISDQEFDPLNYPESNILLYGNMDTNFWYSKLLGHCPVVVSRDKVSVGDSVFEGEDLAIYFIYPAAGGVKKSIGVISGTGNPGSLAAMQNRYFVSGSGFPDLFLFKLSMLTEGESGVELSGYFGNDWTVGRGFWNKSLK